MASHRTLELTLISAKDLKNVNLISKLEVYAVVTISGDPRTKQRTPTDRDNRRNPNWNCPLPYTVPVDPGRLSLDIILRSDRALGDRDIGEVHVPLRELESGDSDGKSLRFVSYQVRRPSGRPKGVLNLSYKFGDPIAAPPPPPLVYPPQWSKADEPVTAYPVGSSAGYPYPAPAGYPGSNAQHGYGYGYPPAGGYGYPPAGGYGYPPSQASYGYGAPPQVVQPPRKNRPGLGLGAGLLGGALGGLLIGDLISDAGAYDAGYDAGFDDGGFGF